MRQTLLFVCLLTACNKPKLGDRGSDGDLFLFVATQLANPSQTDGYVFRFSDVGEEQWQSAWGGG